ncbi:class I adenylate-forming enzyme family protein [Sphingomonas cavernae]|uniref:class I adenylate-forming enzyme family protein n=1 Tax=Sphingomonas cavernae TaxID=2320861 RepID=UPI001602FAAD|nr:class I adenylate-forming enzyme family protein [Sphingomonas cavernae]
MSNPADPALSLVHGLPLNEEAGQGAHTIPGYLEEVRARHGAADAVIMRTALGRTCWSYDDLHARSVEVAKALVAAGTAKDARIGVLMANRPEYLSAMFGIAMAGGVTVALSTFSTPEELEHLIKASAIELLLFDTRVLKKDFASVLKDIDHGPFLNQLVQLDSVTDDEPSAPGYEGWEAFLASGADVPDSLIAARAASVSPSDIGGIFFSSGTTSLPKGIVHSQRAFAVQWWRWPRVLGMREPVRSWTGNGLFWSGNVSLVIATSLSTGGAAILQPVFDASAALDVIEKEKVSFLTGRPHQWARVQAAPNWQGADLSSLKYVTKGELITEHPTVSTDWKTPGAFGTTETMTICTAFDADTSEEAGAGSFGRPLPGNILKIVDPVTRTIVPRGTRGEMCIKGPTLMSGYLGKTAEQCFDDEGFYCTGDGGYVDGEGRFFWEGRLTDMIKTGGANVAPEEVDTIIANYPGVKRSQTVGVPDDLLGEMVVACIVPVDGADIDEAALTAHLKEKLASFKVPRRILFFSEEEFALTGNEKARAADIRNIAGARLTSSA